MRTFCTLFTLMLLEVPLFGQPDGPSLDTLLQHTFQGFTDPADTMLTVPSGDDLHWVNYDQDNKIPICVSGGATPNGWYWESDLSVPSPSISSNDALTSCSFLDPWSSRNRNWLITSPVYIPTEDYWLCWKSLTYYGPDLMDGYHVLVSNSSNLPASFTDTLFSAAETNFAFVPFSLDTNDYIFSKGYIHANSYTDTSYFFIDHENGAPFYHGKLEPHCRSLAEYAGQMIYLAFLHDTKNGAQLQIDDILVSKTNVVSAATLSSAIDYFNILPNPVNDFAFINWKTRHPQAGLLSIVDQSGRLVFEKNFNTRVETQYHLDARGFLPGVYYCRLKTAAGQATRLLLKL